jgi:tetratricopeptide (TPR) repeat protein
MAIQEWEKLKEEGNTLYQDSQWSKAMECYTKAIALNPHAAALYSNRALCQLQLSEFARAREDAESAIRLDSKVVKYYRTLSRALQGLKLQQESAEVCKAGLKLDPCDEVLTSRLMAARQEIATAAYELQPVHYLCKNPPGTGDPADDTYLKSVFYSLKMREERGSLTARKYLTAVKLMIDAGADASAGGDSGAIFHKFRESKKLWDVIPSEPRIVNKFREIANQALEKNPGDADALHVLVSTDERWIRGAVDDGLLSMAKACVSLQPNVAEFHLTLGHLYMHLNDSKNALNCWTRSLELEWNPEVLFYKACALVKCKDEALKDFEQYVSTSEKDEPNVPLACYAVARLCLTVDEKKAEDYWKKGQEFEKFSITLPLRGLADSEMSKCKAFVQQYMERKSGTDRGGMACGACGKTPQTLKKCGRCKSTLYCGRECQEKHWPAHKKSCSQK